MLGVYVTVPVACFRKGLAREYLETEPLPPSSTCYGFLLSLVGETDRYRHIGCRIAPALIGRPEKSTILRTVWRTKSKKLRMGDGNNRTPAQQELLTGVQLVLRNEWLTLHSGIEPCRVGFKADTYHSHSAVSHSAAKGAS